MAAGSSSDSDSGLVARVRPRGIVAGAALLVDKESSSESEAVSETCTTSQPESEDQRETLSAFEQARQRALHSQTTTDDRTPEVPVDYAAELCKDYRETGFCGFGDSCKFLHDRSAYTPSWKAGESSAPERLPGSGGPLRSFVWGAKRPRVHVQEDGICNRCRGALSSPVRLKACGHVFCRECALTAVRESPRCAVCNGLHGGALLPL